MERNGNLVNKRCIRHFPWTVELNVLQSTTDNDYETTKKETDKFRGKYRKSRMNWSSRSNTALHWKHNLANDRTNMIFTLPSASLWPEKNEEKLSSFSLRTFYSVNFSLPLVLSFGSFCRTNDSARRNRKRAPNVWVWSKCEAHKRLSANNSMMQNRKKIEKCWQTRRKNVNENFISAHKRKSII